MKLSDELAPGLLLAAPRLADPNFEKTVVLLGRCDDQGSLGWVINGRELAPVHELLVASELFPKETRLPKGPAFSRLACVGGPVAPATGWLMYRRLPDPLPGELALDADLAVTGEAGAFAVLVEGAGPADFRLVLGCAGWGPGQLESEISEGAWLPAALEPDLLFETSAERIWDEAYRRAIGAAPATFTSRPAKA
jgi:putative transcriptional regulator